MSERLGCWDAVAETLAQSGCEVVFGLPSDEPGLLDAAERHPGLAVKVFGDQRVAGCAAAGYAMASGRPVVLALNSGPGFANAMPALLEAASLGVPLVVVTTRVPGANIGRGAFQHLEQRGLAAPLTGWHHLAEHAGNLSWALHRAVRLAVDGRAGISLVEITDELTRESVPRPAVRPVRALRAAGDPDQLDRAARLLSEAERPLIVVGGGCRQAAAGEDVLRLAEALGAPVFTTAAGRGTVPESHRLCFGLLGLYTTPPADALLEKADVVLVLGSRLEETARMRWEGWQRARMIQVDKSAEAFGESAEPEIAVLADAGLAVRGLLERVRPGETRLYWAAEQALVRPELAALAQVGFGQSPVRATIGQVTEVLGPPPVVVLENGLHDIWAYHYPVLRVDAGTRVVCPGEQTMMGFGVAASAGAAMTTTGPVVVFTGDSAFLLSVGALAALAEHSLGVILVVFDNGGFGWPRFLRAATGEPDRLTAVRQRRNPAELAAAFGGWGTTARNEAELHDALLMAKQNAAAGRFTVIRVPVPDDDVPAGVLAMEEFDEMEAAGGPA
ncbi:thiamine pyrophosphate-binding protein [Amycolatopsis albispora]|uniref:Acetolactate synthase n=1 Tax=Amycolatopsis albispora TaxID=1804986 RepID=A0A344L5H5_9PSEU|nr:thiamine pyrophosphate-binding protein [Amycolatopsis albispora]AXB43299.1 hypothetical protein A4R43_12655 [Amycolatopsis albispora]